MPTPDGCALQLPGFYADVPKSIREPCNLAAVRLVGRGMKSSDEQDLIFAPHRIERRMRGRAWSCEFSAVTGVGVQEPGGSLLSGGARRRLRVDAADGPELFVVSDPAAVATRVRSSMS